MDWRAANIGVIRDVFGMDEISLEHSRKNIHGWRRKGSMQEIEKDNL